MRSPPVAEHGLGSVAVVHVEIKHGNAFGAVPGFERGNRDVVQ